MTAQQATIDTAAEATLKRLYRLTGLPTRVRSLTRVEAAALNTVDRGGRKWVLDPAAEVAEITDDAISTTPDNTLAQIASSVRKQSVQFQQEAHQKELAMKATASDGQRKAKRIDGHDADDNEWRGLSMCQIIRFAGSKGATPKQAKVICERAGFLPAKGTITIQLGKGRKQEKIPAVSTEVAAELLGDVLPPAEVKTKVVRVDDSPEAKADRKARKAARKAAKREAAAKLVK